MKSFIDTAEFDEIKKGVCFWFYRWCYYKSIPYRESFKRDLKNSYFLKSLIW